MESRTMLIRLTPLPLRLLSLALIAMLAGGLFIACGDDDDDAADQPTSVTIALDWYPWSNHSGLYLAQERGYFEDENLEVEIYVPGNPEDGLRVVGAGQDEFAISYQMDILMAREEDIPVQAVAALVQHPLNSIMTLTGNGIQEPADLEGKRIGAPGVPSDEMMLESILATAGLTLDDVEIVNVGFNLIPPLLAGQIDAIIGAYWVHESFLIEREGEDVTVLRVEEWGVPDYYELLLVSNDDMVENHGDVLERVMRAIVRGYADAEADYEAAIDALLAAAPETDRQLEERGIELLSPYWTNEGTVPFGQQTAERWQAYADWMKASGMLPEDADPNEAFTNEFVERAHAD
jgi:putative hydroxymethylpyrimidine transport system substrate-binding protein